MKGLRTLTCLALLLPTFALGETLPALPNPTEPQTRFQKQLIPLTGQEQADIYYQQALHSLRAGVLQQSESELTTVLSLNPLHVAARQLLASLYLREGKENDAMQLLEEGRKRQPQEPAFGMMLARLYGGQGQPVRGIALLESLEIQGPQRLRADAMLAALYQRAGRYEQAISLYRDLLQRDPNQGLWWLGLGLSLEASQRPDNALQAYQQARGSGLGRHALDNFIDARIAALSEVKTSQAKMSEATTPEKTANHDPAGAGG